MENIVRSIYSRKKATLAMKLCCYFATLFSVAAFIFLLFHFLSISIFALFSYLFSLALPFVILSLLRRVINAPRPYELYEFFEAPPKRKKGKSFPSRHAFSIFAIGTLCLFVNPLLGALTLALGILMCIFRVLLGIHFVRDVVAGAIVGVACSLIGALILL
jgi:membrane-associated phospholipid phosphatase